MRQLPAYARMTMRPSRGHALFSHGRQKTLLEISIMVDRPKITIVQINLQKSKAFTDEISPSLEGSSVDIACIRKSHYLRKGNTYYIPGLESFRTTDQKDFILYTTMVCINYKYHIIHLLEWSDSWATGFLMIINEFKIPLQHICMPWNRGLNPQLAKVQNIRA